MGMSEDDKRNCCLVEIQETEAKYYKTLEDIDKVSVTTGGVFCLHASNVRSDLLLQSKNVMQCYTYKGLQGSPELIDLVITGWIHHRRHPPLPPGLSHTPHNTC